MKGNKDIKINTILGRESEFNGDFEVKGSARIDGCINGDVKVSGTLIVGSTGSITGNVEVSTAIIGGQILGNVTAQEKTEITSTARVIGDVVTKVIVIDENSIFQGNCNMNQEVPDAKKRRSVSSKINRTNKKSAKAAIEEALKEVEEERQEEDSILFGNKAETEVAVESQETP